MTLANAVGQKAGSFEEQVTVALVDAFGAAIGVGAKSSISVPPTYLTRLRDGEFELCQRLGIPLVKVLHGEQEYELLKPIQVGSTLVYETEITQAFEKRGASSVLQFYIIETRVTDKADQSAVAACRTTFIVRNALS